MSLIGVILLGIIGIILLMLVYMLVILLYKHVSHSPGIIWRFTYHRFTAPMYPASKYYHKYIGHRHAMLAYCPTIDDAEMWTLGSEIGNRLKGKSDSYKAKYLLAFVQQNVRYVSDESQYGENEHWSLPINTLMRGKGDCEDSAFLYSCLAKCCDLDVITIELEGHMLCGVNLPTKRFGSGVKYGDTMYYYAETTSFLPLIGLNNESYGSLVAVAQPSIPTKEFMDALVKE